jgi:hypothetical protein
MNRTRGVVGMVMALALGLAAYAQQGLTGQWEGQTPGGTPILLDLKATKTELTGTLTRAGQPTKITEGKVEKTKFTFKATLNDQQESFTGEQQKDEVKVWLDRQGPEKAAVLKRVAKEAPAK